MTHDQIKRAAVLLDAIAKHDKDIGALKGALRVSAFAMDYHSNPLFKLERTRSDKAPFDEHGETLHRFLMKLKRADRERVARELRQLGVAVPELLP